MTTPRASRTDSYNRRYYPIPSRDGVLHDLPSWTRLAKLLAAPGLETWKQKNVARQIATRPDLAMLACDEETVWQAVRQALDASSDKANIGTAVHRFTELADKGTLNLDMVPAAARPYIKNYTDVKDEIGWTVVAAEVTVANFSIGYAGTADRFVDWPGLGVVCADIKTGASVYPDTAFQLAAYANADCIWESPRDEDLPVYSFALKNLERDIAAGTNIPAGRRKWSEDAQKVARASLLEAYWEEFCEWQGHRPMPEGLRTDVGVVLHVTEDACTPVILRLDTDPHAIEVVSALRSVYGWQAIEKDVIQNSGANVRSVAPSPGTYHADSDVNPDTAVACEAAAVLPDAVPLEEMARVLTVEERQEYLKTRMAHTANDPKAWAHVGHFWPRDEIASLKAATTHDQLDRIEALINEADAKFEVQFPATSQASFIDDGNAAASLITEAFPGAHELGPSANRKILLANRVKELSKCKPEACGVLVDTLRAQGLAKSLRTGVWSSAELNALETHLQSAEK
jgi:hypothetical protein